MRAKMCAVIATMAVLLPTVGNAQSYPAPFIPPNKTHLPEITAATASWQVSNEPIYVQGLVYYPTRTTRMFDGNVMTQIGVFRGVPVYVDATLEPFSLIYIPIAERTLRKYERLRDNELAATTGSLTPTFPVAPISVVPYETNLPSYIGNTIVTNTPATLGLLDQSAVGTAGSAGTLGTLGTVSTAGTSGTAGPVGPAVTSINLASRIETIPRPRTNDGIWIEYNGAKYYSAGEPVSYDESRFTRIGDYHGFPVYRATDAGASQIWVAIVEDGPLAPYVKR